MATLLAEDLLLLLVRRDKVLGLFPRTRWPARDSSHEDGVRRSLTAVLVAGKRRDHGDHHLDRRRRRDQREQLSTAQPVPPYFLARLRVRRRIVGSLA